MRRTFVTRLERLEGKAKHQSKTRNEEKWSALFGCLGWWELKRLEFALKASRDDAWHPEAVRILEQAQTRLLGGWTHADKVALDQQDRDKGQVLWDLMKRLGPRFNGCYLDTNRLDAHDVTEAELQQLVEVAAMATRASDLEQLAEIVERLRMDGHVMDIVEFEACERLPQTISSNSRLCARRICRALRRRSKRCSPSGTAPIALKKFNKTWMRRGCVRHQQRQCLDPSAPSCGGNRPRQ